MTVLGVDATGSGWVAALCALALVAAAGLAWRWRSAPAAAWIVLPVAAAVVGQALQQRVFTEQVTGEARRPVTAAGG